MSNRTIDRQGLLLALIGPVGSGKTTITKLLLERVPGTTLSVSVTSRKPRGNEQEGVSYFFVSREEFQEKIKQGAFFEYEEVHGNFYGTLKETVQLAINSGKDLLLDVDIRGALNFKRAYPNNSVLVFVVPPSFKELESRVKKRGSMSEKEYNTRLNTAKEEYALLLVAREKDPKVDYFVINNTIDQCYSTVFNILESEHNKLSRLNKTDIEQILRIN